MPRIIALGIALSVTAFQPVVAQTAPNTPTWGVTIGAAAFSVPSYPGSKERRLLGMPLVNITWRDRAYFGPSPSGVTFGAGYKVVRGGHVTVATELGFQQDRPASRGEGLAGMDDRAVATTAGMSAIYSRGPVSGAVAVNQGLNEGAGLLATAQVTLMAPIGGRSVVSLGMGGTVADARQMEREFGVSGAEALRRQALVAAGDPRLESSAGTAYTPTGGLRSLSVSVSAMRVITARWVVIGMANVERLGNAASRSSLVEARTAVMGGVVLGYRF